MKSIHPRPLWCRVFGHLMFNKHSWNVQLGTDRCMREGCYGDDHQWSSDKIAGARWDHETDIFTQVCVYPGCGAESSFKVPDMSGGI